MAYEYDQLGNVIGEYESEEERQARLKAEQEAAQAQIHKQEVITRADGTQTVKTETEVPSKPVVAVAPPTQVATPVAPPQSRGPSRAEQAQQSATGQRPAVPTEDALFNRMLGAESNNQQYNPQGGILTSPKGALGAAQIMPATAANPGYGIKPATPEEIATPEGNRAFGLRYKQGMDALFGGDPAKTAAAYNAGPGRVQQAEQLAAQRGGSWTDYIPKETRDYIQKTAGNVLNAVIPSAQAGTLPPPSAGAGRGTAGMPQAQPGEGVQVATGYGVQGGQPTAGVPQGPAIPGQPNVQIDDEGNKLITNPDGTTNVLGPDNRPMLAGGQVPTNTDQYRARLFTDVQNDPMKLMQLYSDKSMPEPLRNLAGQQVADLMRQTQEKKQAETNVKTALKNWSNGDAKAGRMLADEMKKDEGSWAKMILLGFISPELAGTEAIKLGFGAQWQTQRLDDGTEALIKMRRDGKPMVGYDAATGRALSDSEMASAAGSKLGKGTSLSAEVYVDPKTGARYRSGYDNAGNSALVNIQGGAPFRGNPKDLVLQSIGTTQAKADIQLISELKKKHGTNVLDAEKDYVALNGPFKGAEDRAQFRQAYGFESGMPGNVAGGNVAGNQPGAGGNVQQGAGTSTSTGTGNVQQGGSNVNVPLAEQKVNKDVNEAGRKEIIKKAGDVVAEGDKLVTTLVNVERAASDALTKKNNFGTLIHGMIPGEQTVGEFFKTQDHINTMNVLEQVNKQAAVNAKMLGTNPTDRDLQFVTSTKPDITWSPEAVADWLRKSADGTRRTLDFARKQIETGGRYIPETPQEGSAPLGTAQNPIKLK